MKANGAVHFINQFFFLPLLTGYRLFLSGLFALFSFFDLVLCLGMWFDLVFFSLGI